jgi:hypothetical protein
MQPMANQYAPAAGVVVREVQRPADRLYLVAHDPATGRPRLGPRQLGLGLAAAVLGELLLSGLIELTDGAVRASDRQPYLRRVRHHTGGLTIMGFCVESHRRVTPDKADQSCSWCGVPGVEVFPDRMVWDVRELIASERVLHPVLDWLTVLATDAPTLVARRLAEEEWLVAECRRSLWSERALRSWVPVNVVEADGARQAVRRIACRLDRQPGPHECLVAGLVDAVALTRLVVADVSDPPAAAQALIEAAARLDEPLRLLVEQTKAAADNAVMTHTG